MGKGITSSFRLGAAISKNFEKRSKEDTTLLYSIIQDAVNIIHIKDEVHIETAIGFLVEIYSPYIKKVATKINKRLDNFMEYDDIYQEVNVIFLSLLYKYDKDKSTFSYYITYMLPQYVYVWSKKVLDASFHLSFEDASIIESTLPHPHFSKRDSVYAYFDSLILENEYVAFIQERSLKKSRSTTVEEVCHRFFLGNETCAVIAHDLSISYHAVYEIINRIKKELKYYLHNNKYTGFTITSTGIEF